MRTPGERQMSVQLVRALSTQLGLGMLLSFISEITALDRELEAYLIGGISVTVFWVIYTWKWEHEED